MNTPSPQDINLAARLCPLADSLPLTQAWKDTAAQLITDHTASLNVYKRQHIKTIDACLWMHRDKRISERLHIGDDLSIEGVAELRRQWEELRAKGEELDLAISSHMAREQMVTRGVAESVELVCTGAAVVAALKNWRST